MERRDAPDMGSKITDMQNALESLTHTVNNLASKTQVISKAFGHNTPVSVNPRIEG